MKDVLTTEERTVVDAARVVPGAMGTTAKLLPIIDRLAAVVERLPRYADTGEPFVPGRDPAWVIDHSRHWEAFGGDLRYLEGSWRGPYYSTSEAARQATQAAHAAAKEGSDER